MLMLFDTETTGIYNFKAKPEDQSQPNLVQIAWGLDNEEDAVEWSEFIIYPDGWEIPSSATAIHGITTKMAREHGAPLEEVLTIFTEAFNKATTIIAHNLNFDYNVMRSVYLRKGIAFPSIEGKGRYCTMLASMNILKLPSQWGSGYKWPKLDESYRFLVDEKGFEGAHDALNDVKACREVYLKLQERKLPPA